MTINKLSKKKKISNIQQNFLSVTYCIKYNLFVCLYLIYLFLIYNCLSVSLIIVCFQINNSVVAVFDVIITSLQLCNFTE